MFKVYRGNPIGEFGGKSTILSIAVQCTDRGIFVCHTRIVEKTMTM